MKEFILKDFLNYSSIDFYSWALFSHRSQWVIITVTSGIYFQTTLHILVAYSIIMPNLSYLTTINILFIGPSVSPAKMPIEWASLSDTAPKPGVSRIRNPEPSHDSDIVNYLVIDSPPNFVFSNFLQIVLNKVVLPLPKVPNNITYLELINYYSF